MSRRRPTIPTTRSASSSALPQAAFRVLQETGTDALHAPCKGEAPALSDLLGGHIDFYRTDRVAEVTVNARSFLSFTWGASKGTPSTTS